MNKEEIFCSIGSVVLFLFMWIGNPSEVRQVGCADAIIILGCTSMVLKAIRRLGEEEED